MHFVVSLRPKARVWLGIRRPRNLVVSDEVANLDSKLSKANLVKGTGVCVCMFVCACARICTCVRRCACGHFVAPAVPPFCVAAPAAPQILLCGACGATNFCCVAPAAPQFFKVLSGIRAEKFLFKAPSGFHRAEKFFL